MTFFDRHKEGIATTLLCLLCGGFVIMCIAYTIDRDSSALSDVTISEFKENEKIEGKVIAHHKTGKSNHRSIIQLDDGRYYVTSSFEFTGRTVQKTAKKSIVVHATTEYGYDYATRVDTKYKNEFTELAKSKNSTINDFTKSGFQTSYLK